MPDIGDFSGPEYNPGKDDKRLRGQHETIRDFMLGGDWRTLSEIEEQTGHPQASISAQLRHLRKKKFGGYQVERRRRAIDGAVCEYRVLPPATDGQKSLF